VIVTTDEGHTFTPWSDGWAVGFIVTSPGRPTRYVYLNPSGGSDDGSATVFVYAGEEPDGPAPGIDGPVTHVTLFDGPLEDDAP